MAFSCNPDLPPIQLYHNNIILRLPVGQCIWFVLICSFQEMLRCCIIVVLSLQLSSLLLPSVAGIQCYRCNSIETPSCEHANGNRNQWQTCQDDMCLTGTGFATILGNRAYSITIVISAFLWRYKPVRRTGKSDDWLTIFSWHNKVDCSEIPIVLSNLLYHYSFHWIMAHFISTETAILYIHNYLINAICSQKYHVSVFLTYLLYLILLTITSYCLVFPRGFE